MEYFTCIDKNRDKYNRICAYQLQSIEDTSITEWIDPQSLKRLIIANKYCVVNLNFGKDGKLRDAKSVWTTKKVVQTDFIAQKIEDTKHLLAKASLMGFTITKIPSENDTFCYLLSKSYDNHILYIPDEVVSLNDRKKVHGDNSEYTFADAINRIQGHLIVVGGRGLKYTNLMFYRCALKTLDLQYFDTSNVISMQGMFKKFFLDSTLDLSTLKTDKVLDMDYMFYHSIIPAINLRGFKTNKVTNMCAMFANIDGVRQLDLTSFSIQSVKRNGVHFLLKGCSASYYDLSSIPMTKEAFFDAIPSDREITVKVANQDLVDWYKASSLYSSKAYSKVNIIC